MAIQAAAKTPRHRWLATHLSLLALVALAPRALVAGDSALITASGSVAPTASVEVPAVQTSNPPQITSDGRTMTVANAEPLTLMANVCPARWS